MSAMASCSLSVCTFLFSAPPTSLAAHSRSLSSAALHRPASAALRLRLRHSARQNRAFCGFAAGQDRWRSVPGPLPGGLRASGNSRLDRSRAAGKSEAASTETDGSVRSDVDGNISSAESSGEGVDPSTERLFSNLNVSTLRHEPGTVGGSILLVAGTTVGAGILAIPAVTKEAGFLPSSLACTGCWLYMVLTGLLVAEVNINTMCELGSGGVSLVSMASRTLGQVGVGLACVAYLFIHYALLVAYVARSSEIVSSAVGSPLWLSACLFTGIFGGICFLGSQRTIDIVNGFLIAGILTSFTILLGIAAGNVNLDSLLRTNFSAVPQSIPIIALSFVYQNVVPVVCTNLEGDRPKIRAAITIGTAVPLLMFLAWDAVILGSIPVRSGGEIQAVMDPLKNLQSQDGIVGPVVAIFSLLAVATSYIGFVLGLTDFLSDLLKLPSGRSRGLLPYLLTLLPPLGLALTSPDIFFNALDFAGTYGVLVLFGILPAAMAWSERYSDVGLPLSTTPIVPGGRLTLGAIMGIAGLVIGSELLSTLHVLP